MSVRNPVHHYAYICADGRLFNPGTWIRLPATSTAPHGSIGKFGRAYTNPRLGRMAMVICWRPLECDGRPTKERRPDSLFLRLDATDRSDILERSWYASKPSARKKRTGTSVVPFQRPEVRQ